MASGAESDEKTVSFVIFSYYLFYILELHVFDMTRYKDKRFNYEEPNTTYISHLSLRGPIPLCI
jgi:hypothetical protein